MNSYKVEYTAVIRTDRCGDLLKKTVDLLTKQSMPPKKIIFVDSSMDSACAAELAKIGDKVVEYPDAEFNFSRAINVGIDVVSTPNVLILSSHVLLESEEIIETGWREAHQRNIVAWCGYPANGDKSVREFEVQETSRRNFNGHNGLSNSCAMIPTDLAKLRPFREEVFASEDQEWTAWYLNENESSILRLKAKNLVYSNPNFVADTMDPSYNPTKRLNEIIAVAYYVNRRNLRPDKIISRVARGCFAIMRQRPRRAFFHWSVAFELTKANFYEPRRKSKYF